MERNKIVFEFVKIEKIRYVSLWGGYSIPIEHTISGRGSIYIGFKISQSNNF